MRHTDQPMSYFKNIQACKPQNKEDESIDRNKTRKTQGKYFQNALLAAFMLNFLHRRYIEIRISHFQKTILQDFFCKLVNSEFFIIREIESPIEGFYLIFLYILFLAPVQFHFHVS